MRRRRNLILSSLLFLAALLAEIYCFLEFRKDMLSVLGTGVVLLAAAFIMLDSALGMFDGESRGKKQQGQEEKLPEDLEKHLADLEKMQKASFVVMKKNLMWQQRILHEFSSQMEQQRETVLKAGKLVAKYEKDGIAELAAVIAAKPGFDGDEILAEIQDINKHLEKLSEELIQVKDSIGNIQITAPAAAAAAPVGAEAEYAEAPVEAEAAVSEEISQELLDSVLEEAELAPAEEAAPLEEPEPVPTAAAPDLSDPNKMMSPDDIAALLASMGGEEAPAAEPEPEPEPAPAPAAPDLGDPNKMMSPDDIAALLASMGGEEAPAAEPEPEPEPALAAPDLSDPNKMMSPDDIAALLASMGQS